MCQVSGNPGVKGSGLEAYGCTGPMGLIFQECQLSLKA